MMEYYAVDKMLGFQDWGKDDIYIDIGAAGSPFAKWLRERRGIMAYGGWNQYEITLRNPFGIQRFPAME